MPVRTVSFPAGKLTSQLEAPMDELPKAGVQPPVGPFLSSG